MNHGTDYQNVDKLFEELRNISRRGAYMFNNGSKAIFKDFMEQFQTLDNVIDPLKIALDVVIKFCPAFDFDETCKGNGYRSIIDVTISCLEYNLKLAGHVLKAKERFFFRSYHLFMELKSSVLVLCKLLTIVQFAVVLLHGCDEGCLFADEYHYSGKMLDDLMADFERLNRECFYGRSFAFQYSASFKPTLNVIAVAMAAYGDGYDRHDNGMARALSSVIHSGKYMIDPELRAKRIVQLTKNTSMGFCKAFWSITESHGIQHMPLLLCPAVSVNAEMRIPCTSFTIPSCNGSIIVELPESPVGSSHIQGRLLSYFWREGQGIDSSSFSASSMNGVKRPMGKSSQLIFHCHGGGFVAQSSKSHEFYLRYWAKELHAPILSIDYSLSPEAPFPQALNECFFAYAWALQNAHLLGTTAETVCVVGDSAGGNLVVALTLMAIKKGIRKPDCIAAAYPALLIEYVPSPSRLLSVMDPMLPLGVLKACLLAYALPKNSKVKKESIKTVCTGHNYNAYDLNLGSTHNHHATELSVGASSMHRAFSDSDLPMSMIARYLTAKEEMAGPGDFFYPMPHRCRFGRHASEQWNASSLTNSIENLSMSNSDLNGQRLPSPLTIQNDTLQTVSNGDTAQNGSACSSVSDDCAERPSPVSQAQRSAWLKKVSSSLRHKRSFSAGNIISSKERHRAESFIDVLDENEAENTTKGPTDVIMVEANEVINGSNTEAISNSNTLNDVDSFVTCSSRISSQSQDRSDENDSPSFYHHSMIDTVRNPLLSPLEAPDKLLEQLPLINIVACALDPLLDDSVEFCKRVKAAGGSVELFVVDKLPHGFLQLGIVSEEAKEGSDLMLACMKKMLGIKHNPKNWNKIQSNEISS